MAKTAKNRKKTSVGMYEWWMPAPKRQRHCSDPAQIQTHETDEQKDQAVIIIRNALVNHSLVADAEINLSATLCELTQL